MPGPDLMRVQPRFLLDYPFPLGQTYLFSKIHSSYLLFALDFCKNAKSYMICKDNDFIQDKHCGEMVSFVDLGNMNVASAGVGAEDEDGILFVVPLAL